MAFPEFQIIQSCGNLHTIVGNGLGGIDGVNY